MIEDKIEISIPTYNRANYLDKTLEYLLNSPFKDCKIIVRDNASPDNTPEICEKYSKLFSNIHIIRNNRNIGGNANILRGYEEATSTYIWVIGDNDYLNFDNCDDFIEAIESEKYDSIICCSALYKSEDSPNPFPTPNDEPISELIRRNSENKENYLENTAHELISIIKNHYFLIGGFVPSIVYKSSIFDAETLITCYDYVARSHPHLPLVAKSLNENFLTYKTKNDVIFYQENPQDSEITDFTWFPRHLECMLLVKDKKFQNYGIKYIGNELYFTIAVDIVYAKAYEDPNLKPITTSLIKTTYLLKGWFKGFLYQIFIMLCYLIPTIICKKFVEHRKKMLNKE